MAGGVPALRAGDLNRRIQIERSIDVDNGYNTEIGWEEVASVWAQYLPGKGSERREAAVTQARVAASFRIRWSQTASTIGPRDRILFDGRAYLIDSAVEIRRRETIEIVATAEV